MSTSTTPPSPTPAGNDPTATPVDGAPAVLSFEDRLRTFWNENRVAIFALCVLVLVVMYVLLNLVTDLLYGVIDPRIRFE